MRLGHRIERLFGGRRGASPVKVWRALYPLCEAVLVNTDHGRFLCSPHDNVIGRSIFMTGQFDYDAFKALLDLISPRLPSSAIFVDVGANIGTHTIYALLSGKFERAICFEPEPNNFRLLQMNIAANDLTDRCDVRNVALGARSGTVRMSLSTDNHGDHRISVSGKIIVPVTTLDEALFDIDSKQCFLHMDVQGYEASVLEGAPKLLSESDTLYTEFWPDELESNGSLQTFLSLIAPFTSIIDMTQEKPIDLKKAIELYRGGVGTNLLLRR